MAIGPSGRAFRTASTDSATYLPRQFGRRGAVASNSYLATQAGRDILKDGGNAVDAAVAAVLVEGVVNPQMGTLGGECPALIRPADGAVAAINGNTRAPRAATPDAYRARGYSAMPAADILAAGVPATFGALVTALQRYGRRPLASVAEPARDLCRNGFPAHQGLVAQEKFGIAALAETFRTEWPESAAVYLPNGTVPAIGQELTNPALAATLEHVVAAERQSGGDRATKLQAAHDAFYRGEIADAVARFSTERDGLLTRADVEAFTTRVESAVHLDHGATRVHKCGAWTQGPAMLQALAILQHTELTAMRHNGTDYLHTLIEAIKLAFADREQYFGDPAFADVPDGLLDAAYARRRAALIAADRADDAVRPGDPVHGHAELPADRRLGGAAWGPGTVHVDAVDAEGTMAAFTPSGGWLKSHPVVPELGVPLGNRLMTFYLDPPSHPNVVAPGKQPRTTLSPSLVERGGAPWSVFGTMGGDQQDQWQLQYLLNRLLFDMTPQEAIEAPKFSSEHFPGFFAPHSHFPRRVRIEPRVPESVRSALAARGHEIEVGADWSEGFLGAIERHADGTLEAGHDPRGAKGEIFASLALCW